MAMRMRRRNMKTIPNDFNRVSAEIHIRETIAELQVLLALLADGTKLAECRMRESFRFAYNNLNCAWNMRNLTLAGFNHASDSEMNDWHKPPKEFEPEEPMGKRRISKGKASREKPD